MKPVVPVLSAIALLVSGLPAGADEVTENLDNAKASYSSGAYSEAIQALDYAGQLIRQKKGEAVVKLLPVAPTGWTAEEGETEASAAALMGGGVTAKRSYRRGDNHVTISIQSDSAVMQYAAMFSNPMLMTASGAKMESVKGQKIAVTFKAGGTEGNIKAVVDNRYYVEINGDGVTRDELVAFAKAMDFVKLAGLK